MSTTPTAGNKTPATFMEFSNDEMEVSIMQSQATFLRSTTGGVAPGVTLGTIDHQHQAALDLATPKGYKSYHHNLSVDNDVNSECETVLLEVASQSCQMLRLPQLETAADLKQHVSEHFVVNTSWQEHIQTPPCQQMIRKRKNKVKLPDAMGDASVAGSDAGGGEEHYWERHEKIRQRAVDRATSRVRSVVLNAHDLPGGFASEFKGVSPFKKKKLSGASNDMLDVVNLSFNSVVVTSEMVLLHVWRSRREARAFQNSFVELAHFVSALGLPAPLSVPLSVAVPHQCRYVTATWLPPVLQEETHRTSEGSLAEQIPALFKAFARAPEGSKHFGVFRGADHRVYLIPRSVHEVLFHPHELPRGAPMHDISAFFPQRRAFFIDTGSVAAAARRDKIYNRVATMLAERDEVAANSNGNNLDKIDREFVRRLFRDNSWPMSDMFRVIQDNQKWCAASLLSDAEKAAARRAANDNKMTAAKKKSFAGGKDSAPDEEEPLPLSASDQEFLKVLTTEVVGRCLRSLIEAAVASYHNAELVKSTYEDKEQDPEARTPSALSTTTAGIAASVLKLFLKTPKFMEKILSPIVQLKYGAPEDYVIPTKSVSLAGACTMACEKLGLDFDLKEKVMIGLSPKPRELSMATPQVPVDFVLGGVDERKVPKALRQFFSEGKVAYEAVTNMKDLASPTPGSVAKPEPLTNAWVVHALLSMRAAYYLSCGRFSHKQSQPGSSKQILDSPDQSAQREKGDGEHARFDNVKTLVMATLKVWMDQHPEGARGGSIARSGALGLSALLLQTLATRYHLLGQSKAGGAGSMRADPDAGSSTPPAMTVAGPTNDPNSNTLTPLGFVLWEMWQVFAQLSQAVAKKVPRWGADEGTSSTQMDKNLEYHHQHHYECDLPFVIHALDFAAQHLQRYARGDVRAHAVPAALIADENSNFGTMVKSIRAPAHYNDRHNKSSVSLPSSPSLGAAADPHDDGHWQVPRYEDNALGDATNGAMLVSNLIFAVLDDMRYHLRREMTISTDTVSSSAGFLSAVDPCALIWDGPLQFAMGLAGHSGFVSTQILSNHRVIPAILDLIDGEQKGNSSSSSTGVGPGDVLTYTIEGPESRDQLYASVRDLATHHGTALMKAMSVPHNESARPDLANVMIGYAVQVGLPFSRCLRAPTMLVLPSAADQLQGGSGSNSPAPELDTLDEDSTDKPISDPREAIYHSIISSMLLALAAWTATDAASTAAGSPLPASIIDTATKTLKEVLGWVGTASRASQRDPRHLLSRRSSIASNPATPRFSSFHGSLSDTPAQELARSGAQLYITVVRAFGVALRQLGLTASKPLKPASNTIQSLFGELTLDAFEHALGSAQTEIDITHNSELVQKIRRILGALPPELLTAVEKDRLERVDREEIEALSAEESHSRGEDVDAEDLLWKEIEKDAAASWQDCLDKLAADKRRILDHQIEEHNVRQATEREEEESLETIVRWKVGDREQMVFDVIKAEEEDERTAIIITLIGKDHHQARLLFEAEEMAARKIVEEEEVVALVPTEVELQEHICEPDRRAKLECETADEYEASWIEWLAERHEIFRRDIAPLHARLRKHMAKEEHADRLDIEFSRRVDIETMEVAFHIATREVEWAIALRQQQEERNRREMLRRHETERYAMETGESLDRDTAEAREVEARRSIEADLLLPLTVVEEETHRETLESEAMDDTEAVLQGCKDGVQALLSRAEDFLKECQGRLEALEDEQGDERLLLAEDHRAGLWDVIAALERSERQVLLIYDAFYKSQNYTVTPTTVLAKDEPKKESPRRQEVLGGPMALRYPAFTILYRSCVNQGYMGDALGLAIFGDAEDEELRELRRVRNATVDVRGEFHEGFRHDRHHQDAKKRKESVPAEPTENLTYLREKMQILEGQSCDHRLVRLEAVEGEKREEVWYEFLASMEKFYEEREVSEMLATTRAGRRIARLGDVTITAGSDSLAEHSHSGSRPSSRQKYANELPALRRFIPRPSRSGSASSSRKSKTNPTPRASAADLMKAATAPKKSAVRMMIEDMEREMIRLDPREKDRIRQHRHDMGFDASSSLASTVNTMIPSARGLAPLEGGPKSLEQHVNEGWPTDEEISAMRVAKETAAAVQQVTGGRKTLKRLRSAPMKRLPSSTEPAQPDPTVSGLPAIDPKNRPNRPARLMPLTKSLLDRAGGDSSKASVNLPHKDADMILDSSAGKVLPSVAHAVVDIHRMRETIADEITRAETTSVSVVAGKRERPRTATKRTKVIGSEEVDSAALEPVHAAIETARKQLDCLTVLTRFAWRRIALRERQQRAAKFIGVWITQHQFAAKRRQQLAALAVIRMQHNMDLRRRYFEQFSVKFPEYRKVAWRAARVAVKSQLLPSLNRHIEANHLATVNAARYTGNVLARWFTSLQSRARREAIEILCQVNEHSHCRSRLLDWFEAVKKKKIAKWEASNDDESTRGQRKKVPADLSACYVFVLQREAERRHRARAYRAFVALYVRRGDKGAFILGFEAALQQVKEDRQSRELDRVWGIVTKNRPDMREISMAEAFTRLKFYRLEQRLIREDLEKQKFEQQKREGEALKRQKQLEAWNVSAEA